MVGRRAARLAHVVVTSRICRIHVVAASRLAPEPQTLPVTSPPALGALRSAADRAGAAASATVLWVVDPQVPSKLQAAASLAALQLQPPARGRTPGRSGRSQLGGCRCRRSSKPLPQPRAGRGVTARRCRCARPGRPRCRRSRTLVQSVPQSPPLRSASESPAGQRCNSCRSGRAGVGPAGRARGVLVESVSQVTPPATHCFFFATVPQVWVPEQQMFPHTLSAAQQIFGLAVWSGRDRYSLCSTSLIVAERRVTQGVPAAALTCVESAAAPASGSVDYPLLFSRALLGVLLSWALLSILSWALLGVLLSRALLRASFLAGRSSAILSRAGALPFGFLLSWSLFVRRGIGELVVGRLILGGRLSAGLSLAGRSSGGGVVVVVGSASASGAWARRQSAGCPVPCPVRGPAPSSRHRRHGCRRRRPARRGAVQDEADPRAGSFLRESLEEPPEPLLGDAGQQQEEAASGCRFHRGVQPPPLVAVVDPPRRAHPARAPALAQPHPQAEPPLVKGPDLRGPGPAHARRETRP